MDRDLNAYGRSRTVVVVKRQKIRPDNYFLLEPFSVSLFWGVRGEVLARE
jgi:hypothetical protein